MKKKYYFDTSVLLPILIAPHPQHNRCLKLFENAQSKGEVLSTTNHTYAELYSNLTKLPFGLKIDPKDAANAIITDLGNIITTIDLPRTDYAAAVQRCADFNLISGIIYDALHLQAAVKAGVDVLYTANLRDFRRLYSDDLSFELIGVPR